MNKRPRTLEDLVNEGQYAFIDRNLAWILLSKVDAQDAMTFALSTGIDRRFHSIVEVLRDNTIWEFWMKRDLAIIYDGLNGNGAWDGDFSPDEPKWKTVYLWWRLVMSAYQWNALTNFWEEVIKAVYPEGATAKFIRLNEIELKNPNMILDFRTEFPRWAAYRTYEPVYWVDSLRVFKIAPSGYFYEGDFRKYLVSRINMAPIAVEKYEQILEVMFSKLTDGMYHQGWGDFTPDIQGPYRGMKQYSIVEVLSRPPRLVEETKLLVASCIACAQPAHFQEDVSVSPPRYFCGKECQLIAVKRRDRPFDDVSILVDAVEADNLASAKALFDSFQFDPDELPIEKVTSIEMARLLVGNGANVFKWIGGGRVAMDAMAIHFSIREFFPESHQDTPQLVLDLKAKGEPLTLIERIITVEELRHLMYHGFFPQLPEAYLLEHLFFRRYSEETIFFWYHHLVEEETEDHLLEMIEFKYVTEADVLERTRHDPNPLGLIMFGHTDRVYRQSRRAKTDMLMFKTLDTPMLDTNDPAFLYLPVTRYAPDAFGSLYFQDVEPEKYCGTFYYLEPESSTFLRVPANAVLEVTDKYEAGKFLELEDFDAIYFHTKINLKNDLMITPQEYADSIEESLDLTRVENKPFYGGGLKNEYGEPNYANQDDLDQDICIAARAKGYVAIVLTRMVGKRQIVSEILDTRTREESFKNLVYPQSPLP